MTNSLMARFSSWLGYWRGAAEFENGLRGTIQLRLTPYFDGQVIEIAAKSFELDSGRTRNIGSGLLAADAQGRMREHLWGDRIGFVDLVEMPDDPDVLSLTGEVAGGMVMTLTFQLEDGELVFGSHVGKPGVGADAPIRTVSRLSRVGLPLPEAQ
jgi:hypothetical protein